MTYPSTGGRAFERDAYLLCTHRVVGAVGGGRVRPGEWCILSTTGGVLGGPCHARVLGVSGVQQQRALARAEPSPRVERYKDWAVAAREHV